MRNRMRPERRIDGQAVNFKNDMVINMDFTTKNMCNFKILISGFIFI